jgi:glycogenin glucosyltransferase
LVEFEHLTKDPHPNPPLRALPEHSIPEDDITSGAHPLLVGGASTHGRDIVSSFDGAVDDNNNNNNNNNSTQTYASNTSTLQAAPGTAALDFAQSIENNKNSGGTSGEGLFFSSQGLTSSHTATASNQQASSSLLQQHSTSQHTSQTSSSSGQQIQSGKMTFTLPDFGKDNQIGTTAAQDDVLSPTQPED